MHADIHDTFDIHDSNRMYCGTDGGVEAGMEELLWKC
jgi:hypothetical protein